VKDRPAPLWLCLFRSGLKSAVQFARSERTSERLGFASACAATPFPRPKSSGPMADAAAATRNGICSPAPAMCVRRANSGYSTGAYRPRRHLAVFYFGYKIKASLVVLRDEKEGQMSLLQRTRPKTPPSQDSHDGNLLQELEEDLGRVRDGKVRCPKCKRIVGVKETWYCSCGCGHAIPPNAIFGLGGGTCRCCMSTWAIARCRCGQSSPPQAWHEAEAKESLPAATA